MKVSETDECEIEVDAEYQVSAVIEGGKPWTTRNVIQTMHEHRWLSPALVERNDFEDETCTENLWPIAACAATFALTLITCGEQARLMDLVRLPAVFGPEQRQHQQPEVPTA